MTIEKPWPAWMDTAYGVASYVWQLDPAVAVVFVGYPEERARISRDTIGRLALREETSGPRGIFLEYSSGKREWIWPPEDVRGSSRACWLGLDGR